MNSFHYGGGAFNIAHEYTPKVLLFMYGRRVFTRLMIDEYKLRYTKTFNLLYTFKEDLTSNSLAEHQIHFQKGKERKKKQIAT